MYPRRVLQLIKEFAQKRNTKMGDEVFPTKRSVRSAPSPKRPTGKEAVEDCLDKGRSKKFLAFGPFETNPKLLSEIIS